MRLQRNIKLPDPADTQVAEHRYLWTGSVDELERELLASERGTEARRRFLALVPYKAGEVVYIEHAGGCAKAYISAVLCDYDRYGDRQEVYRVHRLTADGKRFSKSWCYVYPGFIQRGYRLAGLAPEISE